jgi:hypothetical protein
MGLVLMLGCGDGAATNGPDSAVIDARGDGVAEVADAQGRRRLGDPCATAGECDDGVFCNGPEDCFEGRCIGARSTICRDFGGCASARCDEGSASCIVDLPDGACAAGTTCAPDVGCVSVDGCTDDTACDDARACTDDRCDRTNGLCSHVPIDARCPAVGACGAPSCVGGLAADPSGCAAMPDASRCASGEGCDGTLRCIALPRSCTSDFDCADGTACDGRERCDAGRCVHGTVTTCLAHDACHHSLCHRALGGSYCLETQVPGCPRT